MGRKYREVYTTDKVLHLSPKTSIFLYIDTGEVPIEDSDRKRRPMKVYRVLYKDMVGFISVNTPLERVGT